MSGTHATRLNFIATFEFSCNLGPSVCGTCGGGIVPTRTTFYHPQPLPGLNAEVSPMPHAAPDTDELLRRAEDGDGQARQAVLVRHRERLK
jgi:hypothetical protein